MQSTLDSKEGWQFIELMFTPTAYGIDKASNKKAKLKKIRKGKELDNPRIR